MLTGGNDAVIKLWRLLDDRIDFKMKFTGHGSDITCVKFPRHITTFFASTSLDKTSRIWQTVTFSLFIYLQKGLIGFNSLNGFNGQLKPITEQLF